MSNGYGPDGGYDDRDPDRTQRIPQGRSPEPQSYNNPPPQQPYQDDNRGYVPAPQPDRSGIGGGVLTGAIALALVVGGVVGFLLSSSTGSTKSPGAGSTTTVTSTSAPSTVTDSASAATSTTTVTGEPSTTTQTQTQTQTETQTTTVTESPQPTQ